MSIMTKVARSAAIVVVAASAASAATKPSTHNHGLIGGHRDRAAADVSFGSAVSGQTFGYGRIAAPPGGWPADYFGDPYNRQERKCIGGSCAPNWGSEY